MRYHHWGADTVLFDEVAGDTHLIPVAALELLGVLSEVADAAGAEELHTVEPESAAGNDDPPAATPELIQELVRLRLVEIRKP